jgi:hypothetical protein
MRSSYARSVSSWKRFLRKYVLILLPYFCRVVDAFIMTSLIYQLLVFLPISPPHPWDDTTVFNRLLIIWSATVLSTLLFNNRWLQSISISNKGLAKSMEWLGWLQQGCKQSSQRVDPCHVRKNTYRRVCVCNVRAPEPASRNTINQKGLIFLIQREKKLLLFWFRYLL